ncbi:MAG: hypothetical protein L6V93_09330 [Clostridiales bacterium]|nr:MAG: hypothetical protein L6V93_09330 [Clostridiales bacterium]
MTRKKIFFATQYDKGYFDCRKDGFGRVVKTKDEVVNFLINKLENGMKNDEVYSERADKFFSAKKFRADAKKTYREILNII